MHPGAKGAYNSARSAGNNVCSHLLNSVSDAPCKPLDRCSCLPAWVRAGGIPARAHLPQAGHPHRRQRQHRRHQRPAFRRQGSRRRHLRPRCGQGRGSSSPGCIFGRTTPTRHAAAQRRSTRRPLRRHRPHVSHLAWVQRRQGSSHGLRCISGRCAPRGTGGHHAFQSRIRPNPLRLAGVHPRRGQLSHLRVANGLRASTGILHRCAVHCGVSHHRQASPQHSPPALRHRTSIGTPKTA
jgi:hypothetical protein